MSRGRPRQFDEKQALHTAMLVFWRNGYRGTSVDDLAQALGINKPSLYAAFKDKETLFLKVIDYYVSQTIGPAMLTLGDCDDLRGGLEQFFNTYTEIIAGKDTPPGCFVACLLSEECCASDNIRGKLAELLGRADAVCTKAFERHKASLIPALTPEAAGKLLVANIDGISLRARAGTSKEAIRKLCDSFIDMVLV